MSRFTSVLALAGAAFNSALSACFPRQHGLHAQVIAFGGPSLGNVPRLQYAFKAASSGESVVFLLRFDPNELSAGAYGRDAFSAGVSATMRAFPPAKARTSR